MTTTFVVNFVFKLGLDYVLSPLFHMLWPFHFVGKELRETVAVVKVVLSL
jgi:hypothetical protein